MSDTDQILQALVRIDEKVSNHSVRFASLEDSISTVNETLSDIQESMHKLSSRQELQEKDITNIYSRLDKLDMQRETQLQVNDILKDDIVAVEKTMLDFKNIPNLLTKAFTKIDENTDVLNTVKDTLSKELADIKQKSQEETKILDMIKWAFDWFMNKAFIPLVIISYIIYDKVLA